MTSSRYDDLRRMRETKFATKPISDINKGIGAVTVNPPVTKAVTTTVTTNTPIPVTPPKLKRGRPKTGKALSGAERTRRYRARLRGARQ
jgi:hypothetical protein